MNIRFSRLSETVGKPMASQKRRFDAKPRELVRLREGISLLSVEQSMRVPFDGVERHAFLDRPTLIALSTLVDLSAFGALSTLVDLSAFGAGKPLLVAVHDLAHGPVVRFQSFYVVQLCHVPPSFCAFNHILYGTGEACVTYCGRASLVQ